MDQDKSRIDWSERCWKEMLIYQRKSIWLEDTLDKLAAWLGLRPGMTAVDVGCGLGYLGYTYWPYFGEGGRYFGVDVSSKLLKETAGASEEWAVNGEGCFIAGDAYKLPFADDFADWVMCQVVLIHLQHPDVALAEMVRVAKPGGLVMCKEPDNLSSVLVKHYSSLPELEIDEQLLVRKVHLLCNKGRIKLGWGDNSLGCKVAGMMSRLGLTEVGIRLNDRVNFVEPPYEDPLQQLSLEHAKRQWLDEERREIWLEREKREFLAGGGEVDEYNRYREISDRALAAFRQQVENGEYSSCSSGHFYIIKGRKPK